MFWHSFSFGKPYYIVRLRAVSGERSARSCENSGLRACVDRCALAGGTYRDLPGRPELAFERLFDNPVHPRCPGLLVGDAPGVEGPVSPAARCAIILAQGESAMGGVEPYTHAEILCRGQDVFRSQSKGNGVRTCRAPECRHWSARDIPSGPSSPRPRGTARGQAFRRHAYVK